MLVLGSTQICKLAPPARLIECLREAFRREFSVPQRQVVPMPGGAGDRLFLSMPIFDARGVTAVKLATVFPDNSSKSLPSIQALIVLFSMEGTPVAVLDGTVVTHLRTAAASALASSYLSRADSTHLLVIGTGALAPSMAAAHCVVRPIARVSVWGRQRERAEAAGARLRPLIDSRVDIHRPYDLEAAARSADIICCATSSSAPILAGKWLKAGTFVDLVGSFSPSKRESDDDVVRRAARIFVDTREGTLSEAGDLLDPIARGVIGHDRIAGELADLACARVRGRVDDEEIIVFKSVGTAIEDLAAAEMIVDAAQTGVPSI